VTHSAGTAAIIPYCWDTVTGATFEPDAVIRTSNTVARFYLPLDKPINCIINSSGGTGGGGGGGVSYPDQSGNAGKKLGTDGSNPLWEWALGYPIVGTPTDGQVLQFDFANSRYVPVTPATGGGGGGTTLVTSSTVAIVGNEARVKGTIIPMYLKASGPLTHGSLVAGAKNVQTIAVGTAIPGDVVAVGPPTDLPADIVWTGRVSTNGVVSIWVQNQGTATVSLTSLTWKVMVIREF
jgi:hypothetical protein